MDQFVTRVQRVLKFCEFWFQTVRGREWTVSSQQFLTLSPLFVIFLLQKISKLLNAPKHKDGIEKKKLQFSYKGPPLQLPPKPLKM